MLHRNEWNVNARQPAELTRPLASTVDEHFAVDHPRSGVYPFAPAVLGANTGNGHAFDYGRSGITGAFSQRLGDI